jgi:di- and tripeptidase
MLLGKGILPEAPEEEVLVSGGGDGRINIWRIDDENNGAISQVHTLEDGREEGESILCLTRDGSFLYSGRLGGEINVWDLETRQLVRSLKADIGDVLCLSLGGGLLFAGGVKGVVQVCVARIGRLRGSSYPQKYNQHYETVSTFKAHDGLVLASAFTVHDGKPMYVSGGNDDTISIWDIQDCAGPSLTPKRTNNGRFSIYICGIR